MATICDILVIDMGDADGVDSVSNFPLWRDPNGQEVREDVIHQSIDGSLSIRKGKWKLELCPGSGGWSDASRGGKSASEDPERAYPSGQEHPRAGAAEQRAGCLGDNPLGRRGGLNNVPV